MNKKNLGTLEALYGSMPFTVVGLREDVALLGDSVEVRDSEGGRGSMKLPYRDSGVTLWLNGQYRLRPYNYTDDWLRDGGLDELTEVAELLSEFGLNGCTRAMVFPGELYEDLEYLLLPVANRGVVIPTEPSPYEKYVLLYRDGLRLHAIDNYGATMHVDLPCLEGMHHVAVNVRFEFVVTNGLLMTHSDLMQGLDNMGGLNFLNSEDGTRYKGSRKDMTIAFEWSEVTESMLLRHGLREHFDVVAIEGISLHALTLGDDLRLLAEVLQARIENNNRIRLNGPPAHNYILLWHNGYHWVAEDGYGRVVRVYGDEGAEIVLNGRYRLNASRDGFIDLGSDAFSGRELDACDEATTSALKEKHKLDARHRNGRGHARPIVLSLLGDITLEALQVNGETPGFAHDLSEEVQSQYRAARPFPKTNGPAFFDGYWILVYGDSKVAVVAFHGSKEISRRTLTLERADGRCAIVNGRIAISCWFNEMSGLFHFGLEDGHLDLPVTQWRPPKLVAAPENIPWYLEEVPLYSESLLLGGVQLEGCKVQPRYVVMDKEEPLSLWRCLLGRRPRQGYVVRDTFEGKDVSRWFEDILAADDSCLNFNNATRDA